MGNLVPFPALQGYLAQTSYPMPFKYVMGRTCGGFCPICGLPKAV